MINNNISIYYRNNITKVEKENLMIVKRITRVEAITCKSVIVTGKVAGC